MACVPRWHKLYGCSKRWHIAAKSTGRDAPRVRLVAREAGAHYMFILVLMVILLFLAD